MSVVLDRSRAFGVIYGLPEPDEAVFEQDGRRFRADGTEASMPDTGKNTEPAKRRGRLAKAKDSAENEEIAESASLIETEGLTFISDDEDAADLL